MSVADLIKTRHCGHHKPYTQQDAEMQTVRHHVSIASACLKCRGGRLHHAWKCDSGRHWHVGHASVSVYVSGQRGRAS